MASTTVNPLNNTLWIEVTDNISNIKQLIEKDPKNQELYRILDDYYEALYQVQGRMWPAGLAEFLEAKSSLDAAIKATQKALDDLGKLNAGLKKLDEALKILLSIISLAIPFI